jgi:hypothetical protein
VEKLNQIPRDHGGWNRVGAAWLGVMVLTLLLTGWAMHGQDAGVGTELSAWQERWHHAVAVLHGVFAWIFCLVAGRWMWPHVATVWVRRTSNWIWELGLAVAAVGCMAGLSGLGLLYGAADWRDTLSSIHWWVGLAWPALGIAHAWKWIVEGFARKQ